MKGVPMNRVESIPLQEMAVEMCVAGSLDVVANGVPHSKTCPYTILAQGVQGCYAIACGDGRRADLAEGEAFLTGANLPLHIVHHGDPREGFRMRARWIHLHFTLFGSLDVTSLLALPLRVTARHCEPFVEVIEALLRESRGPDDSLGALAYRQELAFRALHLLCDLAPLKPGTLELLRQKDRLGPVLEFMRGQLAEPLAVTDLARQASLSVPRFHVFFRKLMGRSPMEHLKHLRLSEACRLLATSDEPLRVVAERTGFCNEFHLSREFRIVFGSPPGVWRRAYDRNLA